MKITSCFFVLVVFSSFSFSQTIPVSRTASWSKAGLSEVFQEASTVVDFITAGGNPDGITSNDAVMVNILDNASGNPVTIYFPDGTYYFTQGWNLASGTSIRGESADSTVLLFNLGGSGHLISSRGNVTATAANVVGGLHKDSSWIDVDNATSFQAGDYIKLTENDAALVFSSWAMNSTGQIARIKNVAGNRIWLENPLRRSYQAVNGGEITLLDMKKNIGIESLTIKREDASAFQTSNIFFEYVANSQIKCIQSLKCNFAHLDIQSCTNLEIQGSYFYEAHAYGDGGQGYGVMLHATTGECLVQENVFRHLRHSMILQSGANGNVFGYNYSTDPFWSSVPANAAGDAVLHGNYPYCNLFEGNTVQTIRVDDSHGMNGPHNTFFRNRAELYGVYMSSSISNSQNFVGNEITSAGFLMGNYTLTGTDHYEYGNNKRGTTVPTGTNAAFQNSLYLQDPVPYHLIYNSWPPIGYPNLISTHKLEAERMFEAETFTKCTEQDYVSTEDLDGNFTFSVFPNPAASRLWIQVVDHKTIGKVEIISLDGKIITSFAAQNEVDVANLQPGVYFISVELEPGRPCIQKWVKD